MELRDYWRMFTRRWWIPVGLTVLVGLLSALQLRPWQPQPESYSASMRMLVGVLPATDEETAAAYDPRYYAWLTSEYLVDDFTEVVRSELFARNVSARLADEAIDVPPGVIQGSAATGKLHRIITLNFGWGDRAQLEAIAAAAAAELTENAGSYFQALGTDGAGVTVIDGPSIGVVGPSLRGRLDLPLRMFIAFLIGLGLIFLLDYMDTSIRTRDDIADLDLAVLGEIPKHR
jgi:capsular polysaccharide biosynthesis protein